MNDRTIEWYAIVLIRGIYGDLRDGKQKRHVMQFYNVFQIGI